MDMNEVISFVVANKVLLSAVGVAVVSEAMALFPGCKANGLLQLVLGLLKTMAGKGNIAALLAVGVMLTAGCTPLISNVVQTGCGQDKVSLSNKADSDQAPSTSTSAAVPVSVGASPSSAGTVTGGSTGPSK